MLNSRRSFLKQLGGITGAALVANSFFDPRMVKKVEAAAAKIAHLPPAEAATEEDFWFQVQQAFSTTRGIINLNNGGVSPQPKIVQQAFVRYNEFSNEAPAQTMWNVLGPRRETIRSRLAQLAGCPAKEIAIVRNTTEALETIIFGLDMNQGDEILTTTQDYPSMMRAWHQREEREGIVVKTVSIPTPPDNISQITDALKKGITKKTKVIMVSHIIFLTGQITPVREICDMAHDRGIEVIVDAAHSFAHLDFNIPDLGCDYFGTSLHKWLCAPFGTGMLWVKKEKIEKLWPLFAPEHPNSNDIRKFEALGTRSFPAELGIGEAINFHNGIGSKRKEERMRFLKNYWAEKVSKFPNVKMITSLQPVQSCGLGNFSIEGIEPAQICDYLFNKHKIYTIPITHDEFKGVRVTPHVYTTLEELDYFVEVVRKITKERIPG
ncbi:MAG: aminotransferase class V-fold PLP-dependent enzyme [bacterium]|nr:MAG: aminotransferase class V-fold PLP-dependent enzyme [bacterium]